MTNSKNTTYVSRVLQKIKEAYAIKTDANLARFLNMKPNTLAMQKKRGSLNWVRIFEKCRDLDKNWLLHHKSQSSTNKPSILLPYVNQSKLNPEKSLSEENITNNKKVPFPSYLIPKVMEKEIYNCIIVKFDQKTDIPLINVGDVVLMYTEVNNPKENNYYLVGISGNMIITRIGLQSNQRFLLKDHHSDLSGNPLPLDSNKLTLLGRILWMGNHL